MFGRLLTRAKTITENLTTFDARPIGRAALTIVIFLDIFILMSLFDGLAVNTSQLTSPSEYVPDTCREMVLDRSWNTTERFSRLAQIVSDRYASPVRVEKKPAFEQMQPLCAVLARHVEAIQDDKALSGALNRYRQVRREAASARADLDRIKGAYDTALLEKMSGETGTAQTGTAVQRGARMRDQSEKVASLAAEQANLESTVSASPLTGALFRAIDAVTDAQRDRLRAVWQQRNFWFPVKRLGMDMLFLLPLLLVFYAWNARSLARGRPYQVLVSAHLLVVTLIPVLFRIVHLVYEILPRKLLQKLIELLESLQLVALWYYLFIGLSVLAALGLIYLFQKKLFSHDRLLGRRIARGLCQGCGAHLPAGAVVCPLCGFRQYRACSRCGKDTFVHGRYCRACGHPQDGT